MVVTKSKIKQISPKNELIKAIPNKEYIQNPIIYSQIAGNFSLMQTNIMLALIRSIRDRIAGSIEPGRGIVGPLFSESETKKPYPFRIPLASLGVDSKQYKDVEEAGKALKNMDVMYHAIGVDGVRRRVYENIFKNFSIPDEEVANGTMRRKGYIELVMDGDMVDRIFNHSNQYVEHITDIARICRSPRTPRLYIYLSAWKNYKEVTLSYNDLKEFLGIVTYDKSHSDIVSDKFPSYARFHRDVMKPAKNELQKLAEAGKVEFYFEYTPCMSNGMPLPRGKNPDKIRFTLIPAHIAQQAIETESVEIPKREFIFNPLRDGELWEQLKATGNQFVLDVERGRVEQNIDTFENELRKAGLL